MKIEALKQVGLTEVEAKVYSTLLDIGACTAGLLSKKSGYHRRTVYDAMERLIEKGLVGYIIRDNKRQYLGVNPKRLMEIIEKQEDDLKSIMDDLELKFNASLTSEKTHFLQGKQGLRKVLLDQLKEKKPVFVIGASPNAKNVLGPFMIRYYNEVKRKKIPVKLLFNTITNKSEYMHAKIKFLPMEYSSPSAINIYGDKVAIIVWVDDPLVILIENKIIAHSYKQNFDFLWGLANE